jgi:3-dehydroquinate synthetase
MAPMSEVTRLAVRGASPYDVVVGHDVLDEVPAVLGDAPQRVAVCFAEPLAGLAERVIGRLGDYEVLRLTLPDGEVAKTGQVALDAWERLGAAGFTRSDAVVTVGGGATTDMGGFIADPEILALVERSPAAALDPGSPELRALVERAIAVKIAVVEEDLQETGAGGGIGREVLNYGHTMAHAIEKATDYRVRHGEAVALGMVYVAELARLAGRLDDDTAARHERVLASVGLPTRFDGASFDDLHATMRVDKKARGSQLRFVVLDGVGGPAILADPPEEHLRAAYEHLAGRR